MKTNSAVWVPHQPITKYLVCLSKAKDSLSKAQLTLLLLTRGLLNSLSTLLFTYLTWTWPISWSTISPPGWMLHLYSQGWLSIPPPVIPPLSTPTPALSWHCCGSLFYQYCFQHISELLNSATAAVTCTHPASHRYGLYLYRNIYCVQATKEGRL